MVPGPSHAGASAAAEAADAALGRAHPRTTACLLGAGLGIAALALGLADDGGSRVRAAGLVMGVLLLLFLVLAGGRRSAPRFLAPLLAAGVAWLGLLDLLLRWWSVDAFTLLALAGCAGLYAAWLARAPRRWRAPLSQVAVFLLVFALLERVAAATLPIHEYVPVPDDPAMGEYLRPGPGGRAVGNPGFRGHYAHFEFSGVRVDLNALGLRDDPQDARPLEPGEACLIVLGDSVAFGTGVHLEETFHERLQERAAEFCGRPLRVIGAGLPGYGPLDERQMLASVAERLKPDVVVLALFEANDFQDNWSRRDAAAGGDAEAPGAAEEVPVARLECGLREQPGRLDPFVREALHGAFWKSLESDLEKQGRWVQGTLGRWGLRTRSRTNKFLDLALLREPPPVVGEVEGSVLETLEGIRGDCRALGAELVVMVIPALVQADPEVHADFLSLQPADERGRYDRTAFHTAFVAELGARGFAVLDTLGFAEAERRAGRPVYHAEGHWNAHGHALAADRLVPLLREFLR